jgi:putative endonuclease
MATVYILFSETIDSYYIGSCNNFYERLVEHNAHINLSAHTRRAVDWKLYFKIDSLEYEQARSLEEHIKKMKSRKYIENLHEYPEMAQKLVCKYDSGSSR